MRGPIRSSVAFSIFHGNAGHAGRTLAHEPQTFIRTGGHGQGERLAVDVEMAQVALPPHLGDLDVMGGKEAHDFLIAGVTAHGK